ncbi:ferritin-like domain-containing protein [Cytidiella melzeri]|nr:ferritin-like domain-containing protein [Cytidiella melzeri]
MRFSASVAAALVAPVLVSALPVRRAADPNDILVLQFANVLEQLETQFYTQALQKFVAEDFITAGFADPTIPIQQFTSIQNDEATHTTILETTLLAIGGEAITGCTFNFDSVLGSVAEMAPVARVVEDVGVAAYIGALHLMSDPSLLTAAASIATVEARHQTILNVLNAGTSIPQAFDLAFTPSQVLAIASPFISGCDIPVPANPTLSVTNTGTISPGTTLSFSSAAINGSIPTSNLTCQMLVGGAPAALVFPIDACVVPMGIDGPVALFVTNDPQPLSPSILISTGTIIAGPMIAYIDTIPNQLASVAIQGSSGSSSSDSSTSPSSGPSDSASPTSASDPSVATAVATDSSVATAVTSDSSLATAAASDPAGTAVSSAFISATTSLATLTPDEASSLIASVSAATATGSAAVASPSAAAPTDNNAATSVVQALGGPNMYTGPIANGTITVVGWSQVPIPKSSST